MRQGPLWVGFSHWQRAANRTFAPAEECPESGRQPMTASGASET